MQGSALRAKFAKFHGTAWGSLLWHETMVNLPRFDVHREVSMLGLTSIGQLGNCL